VLTPFCHYANIGALKRAFAILLFIIFLAAGILYFYTYRYPTPSAASILPDSTVLFIETPDFPRAHAAFRQTPAYALWQEPSVQQFLAQPLRNLEAMLGRPANAPGNLADEILPLLQGESFIALTHFSDTKSFYRAIVLGADLKRKLIETKAALSYRGYALKTWNTNIVIRTQNHLGVPYTVWQISPGLQVCYTFLGSMVVINFNEDLLREIIAHSVAAPTGTVKLHSLLDSPAYQATLQHVPQHRHLIAYLKAGQILGPLLSFTRERAGPIANLRRIVATSTSMTFTSGLITDFGFTIYDTASTNPLSPLDTHLRAFTTPETSTYIAGGADFAALHHVLLDFANQFDDTPAGKSVLRFEQSLAALGIHLDQEIFPSLGPDAAILVTWREGARIPDLAFVTQCQETLDLRNKIDVVFAALKDNTVGSDDEYPWENSTYLGTRLRTAHIGSSNIAPTYFLDGHILVLALTPDYARELLSQSRTPSRSALPSSPLPHPTSFTYCDLRAVVPPLYDLWKANLTNEFISVANLPPSGVMARHLGVYVAASQTTPTNKTTITYSPLGKPLTWFLGLAGTYLWAKPWLAEHIHVVNPAETKTSSSTASPPPPAGNQTATSQTPSPE
jgi:hypothetical protein